MKTIQNKVKTCFYDKDWKKDLDKVMDELTAYHDLSWNCGCSECVEIREGMIKFIKQQKEFSWMAGHAEGFKEGMYERTKYNVGKKK